MDQFRYGAKFIIITLQLSEICSISNSVNELVFWNIVSFIQMIQMNNLVLMKNSLLLVKALGVCPSINVKHIQIICEKLNDSL